MDEQPPELTPAALHAEEDLSVITWWQQVEEKYPHVTIVPDLTSEPHRWEFRVEGDGASIYDSVDRMMEATARRFPV